jgi:predicted N-acetyltransferase YhbS
MTYGDPSYYAKVGFMPISEADAQAPFPLSHPEGWLAQSLTERAMTPLNLKRAVNPRIPGFSRVPGDTRTV